VSEGFPLPSWAPRLGACGQFHSLVTHWPSSLGQSSTTRAFAFSACNPSHHFTIASRQWRCQPRWIPRLFSLLVTASLPVQTTRILLWWPPTAPKRRGGIQCECRRVPKRILSGVRELPVSSLLHSAFLNGSGGRRGRSRLLEARMFAMYGPSTSTAIRLKGIVRKYLEYDAIICRPFPPTNQPLCISLWQPY